VFSSGFSTAATPIGLSITWSPTVPSSVRRELSTVKTAVAAPASQATGRQPGESSRPVGNNKGVNTSARARTSHHGQEPYQAARTLPGSDPGRERRSGW
jgi:hypothetical protein